MLPSQVDLDAPLAAAAPLEAAQRAKDQAYRQSLVDKQVLERRKQQLEQSASTAQAEGRHRW